jgi:hypothetical protein
MGMREWGSLSVGKGVGVQGVGVQGRLREGHHLGAV